MEKVTIIEAAAGVAFMLSLWAVGMVHARRINKGKA